MSARLPRCSFNLMASVECKCRKRGNIDREGEDQCSATIAIPARLVTPPFQTALLTQVATTDQTPWRGEREKRT
jgi:hypothetical protein